MNTSKQVNVIIGLLMVGAIATLLYFLWDRLEREADATERQLTENAERGGALFAPNCSSCHGLTGKGALERAGLPGAPLNLEENRPTTIGDLTVLHRKFHRSRWLPQRVPNPATRGTDYRHDAWVQHRR